MSRSQPKYFRRSPATIARSVFPNGDGSATVLLTKGKMALIDAADIPLVTGFAWIAHCIGYAYTSAGERHGMVLMHRLITGAPEGLVVDHINGDKLDNRRANLRVVDQSLNGHNPSALRKNNRSGHVGVFWSEDREKWVARIKVDYRSIFLGRFMTKTEAITARRDAEVKMGLRAHLTSRQ